MATQVPTFTAAQFRDRIATQIPFGWAAPDNLQSGLSGMLLEAFGTVMASVLEEFSYALNSIYLQTATAPELDEVSQDYLGDLLPRPAGMSDAQYAAMIKFMILSQGCDRADISAAIFRQNGVVPRMLEPWNIRDTGAWRTGTYWGIDTPANPARWGSPGLRYQGFIILPPPALSGAANQPLLGWGTTAYWNNPGYAFATLQLNSESATYALIERMRALGTTVWVQFK